MSKKSIKAEYKYHDPEFASPQLEVLYETDEIIAINKPHGLLVHRTRIAKDAKEFALQMVRDYTGTHVYPAHRLDRKTSGVLLFSKSTKANQDLQLLFRERKIIKTYQAIVRGHTDAEGVIDYPLSEDNKEPKEAVSHYTTLEHFEIPLPLGKFLTSRYSLIELKPETGRFHQLRKHMAHIFHPIIGDRPHGCNKQNRLWKSKFTMDKMLLHANKLIFEYPVGNTTKIEAPKSQAFSWSQKMLSEENTIS